MENGGGGRVDNFKKWKIGKNLQSSDIKEPVKNLPIQLSEKKEAVLQNSAFMGLP